MILKPVYVVICIICMFCAKLLPGANLGVTEKGKQGNPLVVKHARYFSINQE